MVLNTKRSYGTIKDVMGVLPMKCSAGTFAVKICFIIVPEGYFVGIIMKESDKRSSGTPHVYFKVEY